MSEKPDMAPYPTEARSNLMRLHESLDHAVRVLGSIKDEIEAGTYSREKAASDAEAVALTEGLDFVSALMDVAEDGCDQW